MLTAICAALPPIRRRPAPCRAWVARLLLLAPLAAASAQAASSYVVSYFTLPGTGVTQLWDIDNQGRLLGYAATDTTSSDGRYFLFDNGAAQALVTPAGREASVVAFSETGLIVGRHADPARTYSGIEWIWDEATLTQSPRPYVAEVQVGFIRDAAGQWSALDAPATGVRQTLLRTVSPDGRHAAGTYNTETEAGQFVHDRSTGASTLIPASVGLFGGPRAIDNAGRVFGDVLVGSSILPVMYDPATGVRTLLPDLGYRRLAPRAVNASGQMAGWLLPQASFVTQAWVGTSAGITVLPTRPGTAQAQGMNDLGQVVGSWNNADNTEQLGFIATPVVLPETGDAPGVFSFSVDVLVDQPVFIDPLVAVGYDYAVGAGDPLFKSVSLPVGLGDGRYTLSVGGQTLDIGGNQIVDFTALGFAQGVAGFTVTGIETSALLDPADAGAFVTRLTFMSSGRFTGTQTALTVDVPAVPEPATVALWLLGLAGLAAAGRPQNGRHGHRQHTGQHTGTRQVRPAAGDGETRPAP